MSLTDSKNQLKIPEHIGIIMDGNGRWAKKRGLPRMVGHKFGADAFKRTIRYCNKIGVKYLTVYAFSTENWKRPETEVKAIMNLLKDYLKDILKYKKENVKIKFIGRKDRLDDELISLMENGEKECANNTGMFLNIAINYGGRDEIVYAFQKIISENKILNCEDITEKLISDNLWTKNQVDPDIIIRPSGEYRLSNFLTWQSAYSEFIFLDVLWPDFKSKHIDKAIELFNNRDRRFGGV